MGPFRIIQKNHICRYELPKCSTLPDRKQEHNPEMAVSIIFANADNVPMKPDTMNIFFEVCLL